MYLEDFETCRLVRRRHEENSIEPSRSQQSGIDHVRPIRRGDHDDTLEGLQAIHGCEELVHDPLAHPTVRVDPTPVGDRVQLIQEDDARRDLLRLLEDHPDGLLRLPDPLRHDFGTFDGNEVRLRFRRHRLREESLARPWRTR